MLGALAVRFGWLYTYARQELTLQALIVYGLIILHSWFFSKLVIFPSLSPLRKIPGRPVSLRNIFLGQLPEILRKEAIDPYVEWVNEMKTGIIRYRHIFGSQRLLIADADAIKDVLVTNAQHYPRPPFIISLFLRSVGQSLLTLEGHEHKVQRHLCNAAFKLSSVQGMLPIFQEHSQKLCDKWTNAIRTSKEGPTLVNIEECLSSMTYDIICDAGFDYKSNTQQNSQEETQNAFNYLLRGEGNRLLRIFRLYNILPTEHNRKFRASRSLLCSLVSNIIDRKSKSLSEGKSGGEKVRDLLEMLLLASDVESGAGLSEQQLQDHVLTFMMAGHETTGSSLTWILYLLAKHPDIQSKARQEVKSLLPHSGQPVTFDNLETMTYINCIVKEGLRLYPPVPQVMRQAAKDMTLCGYEIPKGTVLNISVGALHRNPAYWEDPEAFKPERFLDESAVPLYIYQPFLSGPHMCIGYRFALQELKMTLVLLLKHFEFSPLPGQTYRKKQLITMWPYPKMQLYIRCVM